MPDPEQKVSMDAVCRRPSVQSPKLWTAGPTSTEASALHTHSPALALNLRIVHPYSVEPCGRFRYQDVRGEYNAGQFSLPQLRNRHEAHGLGWARGRVGMCQDQKR